MPSNLILSSADTPETIIFRTRRISVTLNADPDEARAYSRIFTDVLSVAHVSDGDHNDIIPSDHNPTLKRLMNLELIVQAHRLSSHIHARLSTPAAEYSAHDLDTKPWDDSSTRRRSTCKCPVSGELLSGSSPDETNARFSPDSSQDQYASPTVFPNRTGAGKNQPTQFSSNTYDVDTDGGETGDDIGDTTPTEEIREEKRQPQARQDIHQDDNRDDEQQNFTQAAAQKAAQVAGVGAAHALNAAQYGALHSLRAANIGAGYAAEAAKKAGEKASQYRLLSQDFWKEPIEPVDDGPKELLELDEEKDMSVGESSAHGSGERKLDHAVLHDADDIMDKCEKAREYDGKLRNRLLGGLYEYLTDTGMLFALSSSLTLNTVFHPLEMQPRAARGGVPKTPNYVEVDATPTSTSIFSYYLISPSAVDIGTAVQAKWVKLLLIDSMVLSMLALFIGYSAMGIVRAFNPWGWMGTSETGEAPQNAAGSKGKGKGFKSDFNDPSRAAQSSALSQKLQLQARKSQFETLKTRLPLIYLFPRLFQVALLFFVCGFVDLMWFVWTNEVGFSRYFKGVLGSSASLPLVAMGVVLGLRKVMGVV
ncbi:hypothetical protein CVT24_003432 [Panaeolus cyanescens]|uniref:Uncharacterized protein n=1 Tax=Panaeolus cyanescens TaxID=181874 RepID=A0A409Y6T0_9AGAR|nr:hypothetical protein CVT24_003432 [Panaeolus cyanescens]